MKNTILLICLLALLSCHKDNTPPPHQANNVQNQQNNSPDTLTVFATSNITFKWWFYDSVPVNIDTQGHYKYLYQFIGIDSLPTSVIQGGNPGDSAIGFVSVHHNWIRLLPNPTVAHRLASDSLYATFSQYYKDNRCFMIFFWQSNYFKLNNYPKDTMQFKVFTKPNNSNLQ